MEIEKKISEQVKSCLNGQPCCSTGQSYLPPQIKVIQVKVEKGFANSTNDLEEEVW